ncbi:hypothetical protein SCHPADRAFT_934807 [Schizopora paradoxa]|uniref:Tudor domain-containing protein n=1 Tax=Schizopora paradoxa TaxID=27342 RepID=A0A0H2SSV6_9AGAM|nr:hypothetical protein SCHPADRAFT_934807 [Schizopora paradoxa]
MSTDLEDTQVKLSQVKEALLVEENPETKEQLSALVKELEELLELLTAAAQISSSSKPGESSKRSYTADGTANAWKAGDECLAKTSNRGWQRARVANVGGAEGNRVFSMLFKDNGQTELLKASDLKPLPPSMQNGGESSWGGSGKKRKFSSKEEEEEAERRKRRNAKKLETREVKAQEQKAKQDSWKKFTTKAAKKGIEVAGVTGKSIFKTPDNPHGKVGVTGSGKGMTENASRPKNKFAKDADDGY